MPAYCNSENYLSCSLLKCRKVLDVCVSLCVVDCALPFIMIDMRVKIIHMYMVIDYKASFNGRCDCVATVSECRYYNNI